MGAFDKKKAFGVGGILTGAAAIIAVAANISEIIQLFRGDDKPDKQENSVAVVQEVDKNIHKISNEQSEVSEESYSEAEVIEPIEEVVEEIIEPEEPPTEPQPAITYLSDMKVSKSQYFYYEEENTKNSMDTIGNVYKNNILTMGLIDANNSRHHDYNAYAMYYLGGKYKTLSGTISVNDISVNDSEGEISILCDEEVVYTTEKVGRDFAPVEFSIDVEGCQWLNISSDNDYTGWSGTWINFILSDFTLE